MSAASRPEQMRTSERVGASRVASTTHHVPSMSASTTAWKSIGESPGRVDRDQPRRDLQRPQEGDRQVGVVPADALAGEQGVDGGVDRAARARRCRPAGGAPSRPRPRPVRRGGSRSNSVVANPRAGPTGSSGWGGAPRPTRPGSPSVGGRRPPPTREYVTVVSPAGAAAGARGRRHRELLGLDRPGHRRARVSCSATGSATAICSSAVAGSGEPRVRVAATSVRMPHILARPGFVRMTVITPGGERPRAPGVWSGSVTGSATSPSATPSPRGSATPIPADPVSSAAGPTGWPSTSPPPAPGTSSTPTSPSAAACCARWSTSRCRWRSRQARTW